MLENLNELKGSDVIVSKNIKVLSLLINAAKTYSTLVTPSDL